MPREPNDRERIYDSDDERATEDLDQDQPEAERTAADAGGRPANRSASKSAERNSARIAGKRAGEKAGKRGARNTGSRSSR
jgi:hypothetical protein